MDCSSTPVDNVDIKEVRTHSKEQSRSRVCTAHSNKLIAFDELQSAGPQYLSYTSSSRAIIILFIPGY